MEKNFDGRNFVNKLGETISLKGKEVTDKAKDIAEVANLNSQIKTCEDVIKRNYAEIGKLYYEKCGEAPDEAYEEQCRAINNARNAIEELNDKIKEIKGI